MSRPAAQRAGANLAGFGAVLLWSWLALFTVATAPVPPLQLAATSLAIGAGAALAVLALRGRLGQLRAVRPGVIAFGVAGIFGYHFLYFSALRLAPPAEAGLIAYLWPMLIVLFSALLPGGRLGPARIIGALIAFGGAALVLGGGGSGSESGGPAPWRAAGLTLALAAAFVWSGYSVLSRRLRDVPTASVALYCLFSALLAALAHLAFEPTRWPDGAAGWLGMLGLGLGPLGLAFFLWDMGMKRGDIQLLGIASYAAPILSTAWLVLAGAAPASRHLLGGAVLVAGGALLAARRGGGAGEG